MDTSTNNSPISKFSGCNFQFTEPRLIPEISSLLIEPDQMVPDGEENFILPGILRNETTIFAGKLIIKKNRYRPRRIKIYFLLTEIKGEEKYLFIMNLEIFEHLLTQLNLFAQY